MAMTLREISRKLIRNNRKQYGLFFFSVLFSVTMVGAYGVLQFSTTITDVLVDGGSTQVMSVAMFFGSMLGIVAFLVYANSLFLSYKSREIGVFLSLGIRRKAIGEIIANEHTTLFQIAAAAGLILSVPVAYLCWTLLNVFLKTPETRFVIGWIGLVIAAAFSIVTWLILRTVNRRYIRKVDIMSILKTSDTNEEAKNGNLWLCLLGFSLIPVGIAAFFTFQNMTGSLFAVLAYVGLVAALIGVYIFIIQLASAGDIVKRFNRKAYYKNIVLYSLLKQRIRQYTRSIFVATLLITFTVFGIGFISAGFIDGYYTALNEPYDYTVYSSHELSGITENRIQAIAEESGAALTSIKTLDGLQLGMQNIYSNGESDWGARIAISVSGFNAIAPESVAVPQGSYTLYYDSNMAYKLNAFHGNQNIFYNPSTKEEFALIKNEPLNYDGLVNSRSFLSSFLILNDADYQELSESVGSQFHISSFMMNVDNWENSMAFQDALLDEVIRECDGQIFANWHNAAVFDKQDSGPEYFSYLGNETRTVRLWALYPLSKLSSTTTQFEAFATYLMLMLFIAIIAFFSAIMVIGLKLLGTLWNDAAVYDNLAKLGMKQRDIKRLISKQMMFIYFIPTVLGCCIGAFTTYRIMLVSAIVYLANVMLLVGGLCIILFLLQLVIFFALRSKVMQKYVGESG
ncbi:putative ABC transport system permease protein [Lachnospiraceae bacterium PF1-22]|uniref:FtsX-like permease family protein n=1 Tax=Ohessyouella blattaphilus TaxID=2949333 RepID=UPI003E203698